MSKFFLILAIFSCNTYGLPHLGVSPGKALVATSVYNAVNNSSDAKEEKKEENGANKQQQQLPAKQKDCTSLDWLILALSAFWVLFMIYIVYDESFLCSSGNCALDKCSKKKAKKYG